MLESIQDLIIVDLAGSILAAAGGILGAAFLLALGLWGGKWIFSAFKTFSGDDSYDDGEFIDDGISAPEGHLLASSGEYDAREVPDDCRYEEDYDRDENGDYKVPF